MRYNRIRVVLWIFSVAFTLLFVFYQRATGPTYPMRVKTELNNQEYSFKLIRTFGGETDATVKIRIPDESITGSFTYKRFKSYDEWTTTAMLRDGEYLTAIIPEQPPAGKVIYKISLTDNYGTHKITNKDVIIRFKGHVPTWIVIIHVLFIFAAMLLSTRAGLEAFINGRRVFIYSLLTFIFLTIGGMVFGMIMQKYAFGAYWTGWPFGNDLTDNKTLVAYIFWIIAMVSLIRDRQRYIWVKIAAVVLVITFLIPHSVLGSEIDFTETEDKPSHEITESQRVTDTTDVISYPAND